MNNLQPPTPDSSSSRKVGEGQGWTYRQEYHLGSSSYSLFDLAGERSAVGLIRWDAQRICLAMNSAPALVSAASEIDRLFLVIESAVRFADKSNHAFVLAALKANSAAIALALNGDRLGGEG